VEVLSSDRVIEIMDSGYSFMLRVVVVSELLLVDRAIVLALVVAMDFSVISMDVLVAHFV